MVAGESRATVWEFCLDPTAEVSLVKEARSAGIENMLAEASKGASRNKDTLDDASANQSDFLSFSATNGRAGEESEFFDFKALF